MDRESGQLQFMGLLSDWARRHSKKSACCANPGLPQEREMKTPCLNLSFPILSLVFRPSSSPPQGYSLILPTPSASFHPVPHWKISPRNLGSAKQYSSFFSCCVVKQCQPRLWASLDWLGRESGRMLFILGPRLSLAPDIKDWDNLKASLVFFSFFLTWPSRRVINYALKAVMNQFIDSEHNINIFPESRIRRNL